MRETVNNVKLYNSEAKVFLDYDLSVLQSILDALRNETGSFAATLLQEYEHKLIEALRLEEDRLQREQAERNAGHEKMMERLTDD